LNSKDFKNIRLGLKSIKLNNTEDNSIINIKNIHIHYFNECYNYDFTFTDTDALGKDGIPHCNIIIKILSNSPQYYKLLQKSFYGREKLNLLKSLISKKVEDKLNIFAPKGFLIKTEGVYNILNAGFY
jgi:hypothetical protein